MSNDQQQGASIVREGFAGNEMVMQHETAAIAIAAAEKAAIESRYILAKRFPRDWDNVRASLLRECHRPGFADAAIYRKPVGKGKNEQTGEWEQKYIEGLSVRFAEAAIRHVANFYASAKSIYDDTGKSIVRVTVMDLETNATIETDVTVAKTIERKDLKKGQAALSQRRNSYDDVVYLLPATDDEVLNKTNALISKALRNGVLRLLPGDVQDECEAMCRKTQLNRDKADPDAAKRAIFDGFAAIGVMPDALKSFLGTTSDQLQPAQLIELRAVYAAIRDGETTWAAIVDSKAPPKEDAKAQATSQQTQDLINKHKASIAAKKPANGQAPATGEKINPETGEITQQPQREPGSDDAP